MSGKEKESSEEITNFRGVATVEGRFFKVEGVQFLDTKEDGKQMLAEQVELPDEWNGREISIKTTITARLVDAE